MPVSRKKAVALAIVVIAVIIVFSTITYFVLMASTDEAGAVFSINDLKTGDYGTIKIQYDLELIGFDVSGYFGKRQNNKDEKYAKVQNGGIFTEIILGNHGRDLSSLKGSYVIGECETLDMIAVPAKFELKPGEEKILVSCIDAEGRVTELFVGCK